MSFALLPARTSLMIHSCPTRAPFQTLWPPPHIVSFLGTGPLHHTLAVLENENCLSENSVAVMERKLFTDPMTAFSPNFPCFLRSTQNRPVLIREERGPKQWMVEYLDPVTGQPNGITREASLQQLRKCKAFEWHPWIENPPVEESENNHLVAMVCIGDHDTIKNIERSGSDDRPKKLRCFICKTDTRYMCSHPTCRAFSRTSGLRGIPLCCHEYRVRGVLGHHRGLTCLEIHRKQLREAKVGTKRRPGKGPSTKTNTNRHSII